MSRPAAISSRILAALVIATGLCGLDASAQWVKATLPAPYSQGYYLDVFFLPDDPQYGWACSIDGYVVRTTDGGQSWRGSRTSRPFLESIQFLTPLIGYTSGPAGIYRSTDGGATWRDISPVDPNSEKSWGCYFVNQNEGVFLVGGCETGIQSFYRTVNGGQTWSVYRTLEPRSGLSDAIIGRDGIGFAVSSGVLWETTDYGRTWDFYSRTGTNVWTEELAWLGNSFLLPTSGEDCDGQVEGRGSLRFSTDRGRTFNQFQTGSNMFGSFLISDRIGWGVGDDSKVYYTEDAGKTWILRNCGIEGDLDDIFFINDTLGWVTGNGLYRSDFGAIRRSVTLTPEDAVIEICKGDSVFVSASTGFSRYTWTDGAVGQARFLTDSGTYVVLAYDAATCLQSKDTIRIALKPSVDPVILAGKTEFCEGDSVILTLDGSYVRQEWSTGDSGTSIVVKNSGSYSVKTLDSFGCTKVSAIVDVIVHPTPQPAILSNRSLTICLDEQVTLSAPGKWVSYLWSNGSTEPTITVGDAGQYQVTVVDEFGCVGTSDIVTVVVLNTRNKVEVILNAVDGTIVVPDHPVGELSCRVVTIRNRSDIENLVIRDPSLIGNVYCSIPIGQLPIIIPPQSSATLKICCTAIDTGEVRDTIIIPDTCSPTILPVVSYGQPILFSGNSRCDVPANVVIFRAGTAHRLSAPYPNPSSDQFELFIEPQAAVKATLVDALGARRADAEVSIGADRSVVSLDSRNIPPGPYVLVVELEGAMVRSFPVTIVR